MISVLQAEAYNTDTTPTQPHRISNTYRTKNNTTNVVIQQNSRKLLMMDILMFEICWAHKKWNKIASDIKLVFYSSTITMMHGPINVRFKYTLSFMLMLLCVRSQIHFHTLSHYKSPVFLPLKSTSTIWVTIRLMYFFFFFSLKIFSH